MDNFKVIYKILTYIEACMDYELFDETGFTAHAFGVTEARFMHLVSSLVDARYVEGIRIDEAKGGFRYMIINEPRLTIAGMEYLENNTMMKKAYRLLKGIKDITPGI